MNNKKSCCPFFRLRFQLLSIILASILTLLSACGSDDSGSQEKPGPTNPPSNIIDTDHDGIPDDSDPDIDNDGVPNAEDAFPYDASESKDSDGDTVGDNADKYPQDKTCYLASDGNGISCYSTLLGGLVISRHRLQDGVVYLMVPTLASILRYDLNTQHYLSIIESPTSDKLTTFTVSTNNRIYLGHQSGNISYLDLITNQETPFATIDGPVQVLEMTGDLLLAQYEISPTSGIAKQYLFDQDANQKDSVQITGYSTTSYVWNAVSNRLYFKQDFNYRTDLYYEEINPSSGFITRSSSYAKVFSSIYNGNFPVKAPIRLSSDGGQILVGSGDIYGENTLEWVDALGVSVDDAQWQDNGGLVSVTNGTDHVTLERRETNLGEIRERIDLSGNAIGLYKLESSYLVLLQNPSTGLRYYNYQANNDNDGDGVENWLDAFPLDVAASTDSDNDGFPDVWNSGYSQSDSVAGLTLDEFPLESACHSSQQSVNGSCDINSSIPSFVPDQVQVDENGVVYLLSVENQRIYRWSSNSASFENPIIIGNLFTMAAGQATQMVYSQNHHRLYIGYSTGMITAFDPSTDIKEQYFAKEPMPIKSLAQAGQLLLSHGNLTYVLYVGVKSVYSSSGERLSTQSAPYTSETYDWNPVNQALYYYDLYGSYRKLRYSYIDQTDGTITLPSLSANNDPYVVYPPVRVSKDATKVFNGAGHIYDASTLQWIRDLGIEPDDAQWTSNGELLTIKYNDGQTYLERRDSSLDNVVEQISYIGKPLGLFKTNANYLVVTQDSTQKLYFYHYQASDDSDNDGVLNSVDDFPTNPAASLDADHDGYPDSWNSGYTQADSSGLQLDAFPFDNACYAAAQGIGGVCDYSISRPLTKPDKIVVDETGVVYMLNSQDLRIARWSAASAGFLDSIAIDWAFELPQTPPTQMTYSENDKRLYLGYPNGAITYIDVSGDLIEHPLARIRFAVSGLAAAGNYLLAQSSDIKYIPGTSHYLISNSGEITSYLSSAFSATFTWNPFNYRMYYFRDHTYPNDILYQPVDQTLGYLSSEVDSPYHGSYTIVPPITLSPDGSLVMLGSGDIYDANTLTWTGDLGSDYLSAVWNSNALVTVHVAGNAATLRYWNAANLTITNETALNQQVYQLFPFGNQVIAVSLGASGVDLAVY